ncbi:MAG: sulfur carrier protein ThiS adenylyltransferase [Spirochaetes bacterium]|nr:MAG: sulfur carrier protein ThiS adenylyltransferase [Spirochaetota bacterium]
MEREKYRSVLRQKRVGIAGAGGLGSNCAVSLARAGVGSLVIVDFDSVAAPNLDRQAYFLDQIGLPKVKALADNIRRIDPGIQVDARILRLAPDNIAEVFSGCDLLIEALDDAQAKAMLLESALALWPKRWLVAASGLAGIGDFNGLKMLKHGNLVICGDFRQEVSESLPPVAPRVSIVANMEADAALEILLGGA